MVKRGYRWFAAIGVGALIFLFGMMHFAGALQASRRYDRLEAEMRERAVLGQGLPPRALLVVMGALGASRHETHEMLARGLFGAAGGMTLLALGARGLWRRRRQRGEASLACGPAVEAAGSGQLCAALPAARRAPELAAIDPIDDEEAALLARFEALERRSALGTR